MGKSELFSIWFVGALTSLILLTYIGFSDGAIAFGITSSALWAALSYEPPK